MDPSLTNVYTGCAAASEERSVGAAGRSTPGVNREPSVSQPPAFGAAALEQDVVSSPLHPSGKQSQESYAIDKVVPQWTPFLSHPRLAGEPIEQVTEQGGALSRHACDLNSIASPCSPGAHSGEEACAPEDQAVLAEACACYIRGRPPSARGHTCGRAAAPAEPEAQDQLWQEAQAGDRSNGSVQKAYQYHPGRYAALFSLCTSISIQERAPASACCNSRVICIVSCLKVLVMTGNSCNLPKANRKMSSASMVSELMAWPSTCNCVKCRGLCTRSPETYSRAVRICGCDASTCHWPRFLRRRQSQTAGERAWGRPAWPPASDLRESCKDIFSKLAGSLSRTGSCLPCAFSSCCRCSERQLSSGAAASCCYSCKDSATV